MQLEVFKDAFSCWENGEEKKMRTRTIFFPVVVADNRNKLHACFFVEMRIPASCGEEKKIESWRKTCLNTFFGFQKYFLEMGHFTKQENIFFFPVCILH